MVTLHHFTNPRWFATLGGFENARAPEYFERFTRKVIEAIGGRVPLWITINEPMVYVVGAYVAGFMPPGKNPRAVPSVLANLLRSHVRAYRAIHENKIPREGPWKDWPVRVSAACNLQDFEAARRRHPIEAVLARVLDRFFNWAWIDAMLGKKPRFGIPGLVRGMPAVPEALGARTCDFLGFNFYTKSYVHWFPKEASEGCVPGEPVGVTFARSGETASDVGWAPNPAGFAQVASETRGVLGLPVYVTENGLADRTDRLRPEYIRAHVRAMKEVMKEGACDVRVLPLVASR